MQVDQFFAGQVTHFNPALLRRHTVAHHAELNLCHIPVTLDKFAEQRSSVGPSFAKGFHPFRADPARVLAGPLKLHVLGAMAVG